MIDPPPRRAVVRGGKILRPGVTAASLAGRATAAATPGAAAVGASLMVEIPRARVPAAKG